MGNINTKNLKIIIIEDEEDILLLYNDYLSAKGHQVMNKYLSGDSSTIDIEKETPDVYLIDYRLPGNKNGIDVAIEILSAFPLASILFITAFELLDREIAKHDIFYDKNIDVLIKPIKLNEIEKSILNLVNKKSIACK